MNSTELKEFLKDIPENIRAEKQAAAKREKDGFKLTYKKRFVYSIGFQDAIEWIKKHEKL